MSMKKIIVGAFLCSLGLISIHGADAPPSGNKLDWYRWGELHTAPSMEAACRLADGNLEKGGIWCGGPEIGGELTFVFPQAVNVTVFRFQQSWLCTTKYKLLADTSGKGNYNALIAQVKDKKKIEKKWISIPVNKKVFGLKFIALEGNASYRAPYPSIKEIEIYTKEKIKPPLKQKLNADTLSCGKVLPLPKFTKKDIDVRLDIDTWMVGIPNNLSNMPDNIENFNGFKKLMKSIREVDANSIRFFAESSAVKNKVSWKSKVCRNYNIDMLPELIKALHKNGIKLYYFSHAWMSPFQKADKMAPMPWKRWDYPYEQSERLLLKFPQYYKVKYPCVISENDFRDKWLAMMSEVVDCGADGIYLMPDEYCFKGHYLPHADCPACTKAFKKMYGYDSIPKQKQDTEKYRKWKIFEYKKLGELFKYVSAKLKSKKPGLNIVSCANQSSVQKTSLRMEHGVCMDILADDPNVNMAQMYGSGPMGIGKIAAFCKRFKAAFGKNKMLGSIQWLDVKYDKPDYSIKLYGYALPQIMLGAKVLENYRLSYMQDTGWWQNSIECVKMIRLLEQWGIGKSHSPNTVCLLISRASEDWWQVKAEALSDGKELDKKGFNLLYAEKEMGTIKTAADNEKKRLINFERFRGFGARRSMEGLLSENGIQYNVAYTDQPDNLKDLKKYKLLILPFGYSISQNAFKAIKKAVDSGTRLLIFDKLAPCNEYGVRYKTPLFKQLLANKNIIHVKENLAADGMNPKNREKNLQLIDNLIKDCGYYFNSKGTEVEYLVQQLDPKNFILYLGNWDKNKEASPIIGLPLPEENYKIELYSSKTYKLTSGIIHGKSKISAEELKKFTVKLAPGEVKLIRITQ